MIIRWKKEIVSLLFGDIVCFATALVLTLFLRYYGDSKAEYLVPIHIVPFSIMFVVFIVVFFIAGLYDKQTNVLKRKLFSLIFSAQIANLILAVIFFYFLAFFTITPKTNLFLYAVFSTGLILLWRIFIADWLSMSRLENVLFVGDSDELRELKDEINKNSGYRMNGVLARDFDDPIFKDVPSKIVTVVTDLRKICLEHLGEAKLSDYLFSQVKFIDFRDLYEEVFDRVPLSTVYEGWFLENVSSERKLMYDFLKRLMDILIASILGILTLPLYSIVYLAIKLEDNGPIFIFQDRIGTGNNKIRVAKFRSMRESDGGRWLTKNDKRITSVGRILRRTRIDELPQLWNVIKGDMSLIGPRPDIVDLSEQLKINIPYYSLRNIIKSGLSGWAQIHQELPPQSLEETKLRLGYDFFYLKNRSFMLDLEIALKTIKTLLSRAGI